MPVYPGASTFVHKQTSKMDRAIQRDEIRRLGAAPDVMLGSVHAITEDGRLVVTSATGTQIGPFASGAAKVVIVAGSQKIVTDLEIALRRIDEHVLPYEDARMMAQFGAHTKRLRVLIFEGDHIPGRTSVILVRHPIGI